jgi:hypothetical protein
LNPADVKPKPHDGRKLVFSDTDKLLDACRTGDVDEVKMLLDKGTNPNVRDGNGLNPLHKWVAGWLGGWVAGWLGGWVAVNGAAGEGVGLACAKTERENAHAQHCRPLTSRVEGLHGELSEHCEPAVCQRRDC